MCSLVSLELNYGLLWIWTMDLISFRPLFMIYYGLITYLCSQLWLYVNWTVMWLVCFGMPQMLNLYLLYENCYVAVWTCTCCYASNVECLFCFLYGQIIAVYIVYVCLFFPAKKSVFNSAQTKFCLEFRSKFRPKFSKNFGDFGQNLVKFERACLTGRNEISSEFHEFRSFRTWAKFFAKWNRKPWWNYPGMQTANNIIDGVFNLDH